MPVGATITELGCFKSNIFRSIRLEYSKSLVGLLISNSVRYQLRDVNIEWPVLAVQCFNADNIETT